MAVRIVKSQSNDAAAIVTNNNHSLRMIVLICIVLSIVCVFKSTMSSETMQQKFPDRIDDSPWMTTTAKNSSTTTLDGSKTKLPQTSKKEKKKKEKKKPLNVLILYPDDMRYDSLSSAGTQLVQTPFLDSLASRGIRFPRNCVTTSICWISRATLFTGQYLARHKSGGLRNPPLYKNWDITWPSILQKQKGYYVGHIGKWQFQDNERFVKRSFNYSNIFEMKHWHGSGRERIHTTDFARDTTLRFLRLRPKDRPFAATVAFYPPKGISDPSFDYWKPKPETLQKFYNNVTIPEPYDINNTFNNLNKQIFHHPKNMARVTWWYSFGTPERYQHNMKDMYAMITEVDQACKEIVQELEDQGIMNETMVIFTADNGFLHGDHGLSGKWFPWEHSIRVPLIIWDPRMPTSKRGKLDDSLTLNVDLAPTILGAAGIDDIPSTMQGRDMSELYLKNSDDYDDEGDGNNNYVVGDDGRATGATTDWRTDFYYEHPTHNGESGIPKSSALVRKDMKYMKFDNQNVESMFHLEIDPMELMDVYENPVYTTRREELKKRYMELKAHVEMGGKV